MSIFQAIVLGAVQGITEFIPISSSGHLVIIQELFNWPDEDLIFDITLHFGTLIAILIYFRKDWIEVGRGIASIFRKPKPSAPSPIYGKGLLLNILVATIPALIFGYFFSTSITNVFQSLDTVIYLLLGLGFFFIAIEIIYSWLRRSSKFKLKMLKEITWLNALIVGIAQVISLLPGISRSGLTISAGMLQKVSREASARFSFLMSVPAVLAANIYGAFQIVQNGTVTNLTALIVGIVVAGIVGYLAIKFMLSFLRRHTLYPFGIYVIVLAILLLIFT